MAIFTETIDSILNCKNHLTKAVLFLLYDVFQSFRFIWFLSIFMLVLSWFLLTSLPFFLSLSHISPYQAQREYVYRCSLILKLHYLYAMLILRYRYLAFVKKRGNDIVVSITNYTWCLRKRVYVEEEERWVRLLHDSIY